ncbi:hypothetical protein K458DRAFT_166733 [Lentithecium fluviatile CBS 122367]|uniref:Uncharacterized protein n=1 Tax=Lentithecium fluviatile CBS 122367 TaxID=1168545 RepID=A0A6G1IG66_9PLEO|nr:hypothetical protein K458DRAFT_166733 [Lentithecium fluviatile CBS 122367]
MSSITTAVPSGAIVNGPDWCIQGLVDIFASDEPPFTYNECSNSTRGTGKSSFETICCDGNIIDTSANLWTTGNFSSYELDLENLVCCRAGGQLLPGGIQPIDSDYTHCSASEVATPLASLAATNTDNAALYLVTYESASQGVGTSLGDWTTTGTPTCLWVETASGAVSLTEITVPAADITTLPPPSTNRWGETISSPFSVPLRASPSDGSEGCTGNSTACFSITGLPTISPRSSSSSSAESTTSPSGQPAATTTTSSGFSVRADRSLMLALSSVVVGLSALYML